MDTPIYFKDGTVIATSGNIRVYEMGGSQFLEEGPGHNLWTHTEERQDIAAQIGNLPSGNCLEIGLGLGMSARHILSVPGVEALTTVEINSDVIKVYKELNTPLDARHKIVNGDGHDYLLENLKSRHPEEYDFIFIDHYKAIDEDVWPELECMAVSGDQSLKEAGKIIGWLDPFTPKEFIKDFYRMFDNERLDYEI